MTYKNGNAFRPSKRIDVHVVIERLSENRIYSVGAHDAGCYLLVQVSAHLFVVIFHLAETKTDLQKYGSR